MANKDLLKEAIADARLVKETAIANAKAALEEAFAPHIAELLSEKVKEMENEMYEEYDEEAMGSEAELEESMDEEYMDENEMYDETMDEELDLEALLKELDEESEEPMYEAKKANASEKEEKAMASEKKANSSKKEDKEVSIEDMSEEDLKSFIETVIQDMIDAGEIEGGQEEMDSEEKGSEMAPEMEMTPETPEMETPEAGEDVNLDELLMEIEMEEMLSGMDMDEEESMEEMMDDDIQTGNIAEKMKAARMKRQAEKEKMAKDKELNEAYNTIKTLRSELNEINLLNAKLLYTNKLFKAKNLTETQKLKVLSSFDKAATVGEVKLVYETLSEGIKETKKSSPINESVNFASKSIAAPKKQAILEVDQIKSRFQKLAGII